MHELFLSLFRCCTIIENGKTNEDPGLKEEMIKKEGDE